MTSRLTTSGRTVTDSASYLEDQLNSIREQHENRLYSFGFEVRQELILPFCRKYGFEFVSGNGSWCFFKDEKNYGRGYCSDDFLASKAGQAMAALFDVLSLDPDNVTSVGCYVSDVTTKDLK